MHNQLAELVLDHCERTGDTISAIAARGGISRQTLSGLVHRQEAQAYPRQATLEALARGLDLPFETVRQAAAETAYGANPGTEPRRLVATLTAYAQTLSDADLNVLLATVRAMKSQH